MIEIKGGYTTSGCLFQGLGGPLLLLFLFVVLTITLNTQFTLLDLSVYVL